MWIELFDTNNERTFVNANCITRVVKSNDGICITSMTGEVREYKTTMEQFDTLVNVNSIQKMIDALKMENAQIRLHNQLDKIYEELIQ